MIGDRPIGSLLRSSPVMILIGLESAMDMIYLLSANASSFYPILTKPRILPWAQTTISYLLASV